MTANHNAYRQEIQQTCTLAGKPERAQAFIDNNSTAAEVRTKLLGERVDLVASMKRMHGITDKPQARTVGAGAPVVDLAADMRRLHGIES